MLIPFLPTIKAFSTTKHIKQGGGKKRNKRKERKKDGRDSFEVRNEMAQVILQWNLTFKASVCAIDRTNDRCRLCWRGQMMRGESVAIETNCNKAKKKRRMVSTGSGLSRGQQTKEANQMRGESRDNQQFFQIIEIKSSLLSFLWRVSVNL